MAYFDQLIGNGGGLAGMGGGGASPSAFTSPGLSPQSLAMLLAMQNHANMPSAAMQPAGPPMLGKPPMSAPQGGPMAPNFPQLPQQQNLLQMLSQMGGFGGLKGLFGGMGGVGGGGMGGLTDASGNPFQMR